MPTLTYRQREVEVRPGETVLEALERVGFELPSSCRAGICQSCMMRIVRGEPPPDSQKGVRSSLRARGHFLPCVARPETDLQLERIDGETSAVEARIVHRRYVGAAIVLLRLVPATPLDVRGGQFVNLVRDDGLTRAYSVANLPDRDGHLELHVRRISGGAMSVWLYDADVVGEKVRLRGPCGECVYSPERERPLLLAGRGTGLAPLLGVARDAVRRDHPAEIVLVHGARDPSGLYRERQLRELAARHDEMTVRLCVRADRCGESRHHTDTVEDLAPEIGAELERPLVFLCGPPSTVQHLEKRFFLNGVSSGDIFSDPFLRGDAT